MKDAFGREITYLRLSVTDRCNQRCLYCRPKEGMAKRGPLDILSIEEIEEIVHAAVRCGITKVRITGGEPLVRRGIMDICRRVSRTPGLSETCLTTNGTLLSELADELRSAGVSRLNISLDSLDASTYRQVTQHGDLGAALRGVEAALGAGFETVKINTVLIGGLNDGEIENLVALTRRGLYVRFIELMPIGKCSGWGRERFVDGEAVLRAVPALRAAGTDGVARLYQLDGAGGTVGLISPVSDNFCRFCNRIRVTSDGKLKPCLHTADEFNLRGLRGDALEKAIREAVLKKARRHFLSAGAHPSGLRDMYAIGG
ncbi:MAG: GTP 3',8-cyclase MoaA [Deltaproteobacteria bacterium]|nr:GTP 3',8-cyclase MoaA [Deltaproteobacteria bacterium]